MKIGLALSGGGIRATIFHLGVLARLSRQDLLEKVSLISTVSGGSLALALVWTTSGNSWPASNLFISQTLPKARRMTTELDLQSDWIRRTFLSPWQLTGGRASLLAKSIRELWNLNARLSDLEDSPRWIINATCYETGKNWRFMRKRMGDYVGGYVIAPDFAIADAVAASAAIPAMIGSLRLKTDSYIWHKYDEEGRLRRHEMRFSVINLWDGGVYDNLGVEALFKPSGGYRDGFDFLVVSDASMRLEATSRKTLPFLRLLWIATDQIRSIRSRSVVAHLQKHKEVGVYLRIGNTQKNIYMDAGRTTWAGESEAESLSNEEVEWAVTFGTNLGRVREEEFDLLFRHGYEVADATLSAYCPGVFGSIPLN